MKEIENWGIGEVWWPVPYPNTTFFYPNPLPQPLLYYFFSLGLRAKFTILQKYDIIYIMKERQFLRQSPHI